MSEDDRIYQEDLDATHAVVQRMYRRSMSAAFCGGAIFSALCALLMYFIPSSHNPVAAIALGMLIWLFFGIPLAVHWWRHYKSIFDQLEQVRQRVLAGEVVHGSQVFSTGMWPNNSFKPNPLRGSA